MEIGDTTLENALVSISDMSGRKLLMLPVKEREMLRISLDGRFTPSDYGVTIRDGKRKIYRVFKVGKKMFNF
mgnify:CR=1 FL=1